eukprot:COSAG05_NODE_4718_length_1399_cov_1.181538_1_plen_418_part_01
MLPVLSDVATMKYFSDHVGQAQVVRDDKLEHLFFPMPALENDKEEGTMDSMLVSCMEKAPREDSTQKLQFLLEGITEIVANIESNKLVSELHGVRLPKFFNWCQRRQPTMYFSLILCSLCAVSYDHDAPSDNLLGISGWSLDARTFERIPIVAEYFGFFSFFHLVISIVKFFGWIRIRFPVLNQMYKRAARLTYLREPQQAIPGAREGLIGRSIVVHGLPHEIDGYELSATKVTRWFSRFGPCAGARVVPITPESGPEADLCVSWAIVTFLQASSCKKALAAQAKQGGSFLATGFANKKKGSPTRPKKIPLFIFQPTGDYVDASPTLSALVDSALLDFLIIKSDPLFAFAAEIQDNINKLPYGYLVPVTTMYIFRSDPELIDALADIGMSLMGGLVHPLCYTFHLFKLLSSHQLLLPY